MALWRHHGTWSTLVQVMACCLMAPSHYLNQCWLIIKGVLWHLSETNFKNTRMKWIRNICAEIILIITAISLRWQWVKGWYCFLFVWLTHCSLVMPYDDINLGQHWLRSWLVAWWHQAITLNQCWLTISKVHWNPSEGNLTRDTSAINN